MSNGKTITIGLGVSASALVVALAVTSGPADESKLEPPPSSCAYTLGESGSFTVGDDTGRCDLIYPPGTRMRCQLAPISDVTYQWSYRGTPLGLVTQGLKRGAVVAFKCKEPGQ